MAPIDRSFRVVFDWIDGAPGGKTGTFVWAQSGGARRWDFAPEGAAGARIGWFSVESGFGASGASTTTNDCLWERADADNVRLGCDAIRPNHPGADAFTRAFTGLRLAGRYPDRMIAGRTAACYAFRDTPDSYGEICVDASDGTPLAFVGTGVGRNKARHVFEARSVTPQQGSVALALNLAPGTLLGPARRPIAVLALPAEFTAPIDRGQ